MTGTLRRAGAVLAMGAWLLGVWLLLWGRVDPVIVVGGVIVVAVVHKANRLPSAPRLRRIRPLRLVASLAEFGWDLVISSTVIGWHALYRPGRVRGAIFDVEMRSRSEFILLGVTTSISLRPGTVLIDLDPDRFVLRIHAMPITERRGVEAARSGVERTEERLVSSFVTREDAPPEEER